MVNIPKAPMLDVTFRVRLHTLLHACFIMCCWKLFRKVWNRSSYVQTVATTPNNVGSWKWRDDRRSERNLCNCVRKPEKNSGLQWGFPWKKWVLVIYEINHIWTAEIIWKWRNDRRSEPNLCNCVKKPEKNSGLQRGQATCKRSQQLPTMLGVVSCWPKSLRPFAPGLKASFQ